MTAQIMYFIADYVFQVFTKLLKQGLVKLHLLCYIVVNVK